MAGVVPVATRSVIVELDIRRILFPNVRLNAAFGRNAGQVAEGSAASQLFRLGAIVMTLRKPLSVLVPQRIRQVPASFAWIDHRLRSGGFLKYLEAADLGLYLFLTLAADRHGLSCWRLDRIERDLPCFERNALWDARTRLCDLDLIAYRPWSEHTPDGSYQVLSVPRPKDTTSFDRQAILAGNLRRWQA
jgi:hypothetical protein